MVMSRSWFDRQTRGNLLDNADYDHDVEEAASIGRSVNEVAVKRDRAAHGLAVDVWSLIWRSTVVDRASGRVEHAALVTRPFVALTHNQNPFRLWSCWDRAANSFGARPPRLV
jgi:hypothetical protein